MLVELIFKNRFETIRTLNLIRWIIIVYTIVIWTIVLSEMDIKPDDSTFVTGESRPYKITYWTMLLSSLFLPFTLLLKKLATKFWYVLLVAFCMKIGGYFERFVIITTSVHRDFLPKYENVELSNSILYIIGLLFLQGMTISILALGIFELTKTKKIHG